MDHPEREHQGEDRLVHKFLDVFADDSTSPGRGDTDRTSIRCPHCAERIPLEEIESSERVCCPSCQTEFNLLVDVATISRRDGSPETLAHFQLLEYLGAGQYGNVWKARDTQLDRIVALKIPRRSLLEGHTPDVFLREARAAAQLAHENIVRVLEVGYHDNVIYIASDFIAGADLRQWLDQRRLTLADAARLAAELANALGHAHEKGVIHRDLKPANIMMDLAGQPHIMDFGLAKRETGEITITLDGQVIGTPAYMSPEQARGESHRVDGRSDLYSLGVILYEMLTGELPFRGDKRMLIVQILSDEPPSPRKLNARVPKDLETICLKCLEKNPDRRYQTGSDLAADLHRWLNKQPILARPVGRLMRTARWCQRHPAVASLSALIVLITAVGFGLVTWQWRQTRAQFLAAEKNRREARRQQERGDVLYGKLKDAVDEMLLEVGAERLKDEPRSADLRRTLTEEALQYYAWLTQQEADDDEAKLRLGYALVEVGKLRHWLGENEEAEAALRQALQTPDRVASPEAYTPNITQLQLSARFLLAEVLRAAGRGDEAEEQIRKNLELARAIHAKAPQDVDACLELAKSLTGLEECLEARSRRDDADRAIAEAIDVLEPLQNRNDLEPDQRSAVMLALALANHNRANLLNVTPRFKESDAMYREAIRLYDQIPEPSQEQLEALASALGDWAGYLHFVEDFEAAEAPRNRAIALREQLIQDHPSVPSYRLKMAVLYQNLGYVLSVKRRYEESEQSHRQALDLLEKLVNDFPAIPRYKETLANTWNLYGFPLSASGDKDGAQTAWENSRRIYLDLLEENGDDARCHSDLAAVLDNLASLHYGNKEYDLCVASAKEAIEHEQQARTNDQSNATYIRQLASHYHNLAMGLKRLEDREGAIAAYQHSTELLRKLVDLDPQRSVYLSNLGATFNNMAIIALEAGDYQRAESFVRDAIKHQADAHAKTPDNYQVTGFLRNHYVQLARILRDTHRPVEAVEAYEKALDLTGQIPQTGKGDITNRYLLTLTCELSRFLADPRSGEARDVPRSVGLAKKAVAYDPNANATRYALGVVAYYQDQWDEVIAQLPALVDDADFDLDMRGFAAACTAMAYARQGAMEQATERLQTAREISDKVENDKDKSEINTVVKAVESLLETQSTSSPSGQQ